MAADLPPISLDLTDDGAPVVIVGDAEVSDPQQLIEMVPALTDPKWVRAYARIVNHIAHGYKFAMIVDPDAFEQEFMSEYNAEDPDEVSVPGVIRLHNYGIPDFSSITSPAIDGDEMVFYVKETYIGIPYKVTMRGDHQPVYAPLPLRQE